MLDGSKMMPMKKTWTNPVKRPPLESTMNTEGDFGNFTSFMRKIVNARPEKRTPKTASSSPVPAGS